jgi:hypothetical protein
MDMEHTDLEDRVREGTGQESGVQLNAIESEIHTTGNLLKTGFVSIAVIYGIKGIVDTTDSNAPDTCAVEYFAFGAPVFITALIGRYLGRAISLDDLNRNRYDRNRDERPLSRETEEEINREAQRCSRHFATTCLVLGGALAAFSYGSGRLVGYVIQHT